MAEKPIRVRNSRAARFGRAAGVALTLNSLGAAALARTAPPPARPVSDQVYSGRWYEIARTPNKLQKDCQAPTSDFQDNTAAGFTVVETCHQGEVGGAAKVVRAKARIISKGDNTRFRMSFFGGLVHQDYWILDHADDNSWIVMGTPGGNFVWLLSRRPALAPAELAAALGHVGALGYSTARLIYPAQAGG